MSEGRKVAFSAISKLGYEVVAYQQTMDQHRLKHPEPFSNDDVIDCIEAPHIVAKTGHPELAHKDREVYYKYRSWASGPNIMKVVVEHQDEPGVLTSAFRTHKVGNDGETLYIDADYVEGRMK